MYVGFPENLIFCFFAVIFVGWRSPSSSSSIHGECILGLFYAVWPLFLCSSRSTTNNYSRELQFCIIIRRPPKRLAHTFFPIKSDAELLFVAWLAVFLWLVKILNINGHGDEGKRTNKRTVRKRSNGKRASAAIPIVICFRCFCSSSISREPKVWGSALLTGRQADQERIKR